MSNSNNEPGPTKKGAELEGTWSEIWRHRISGEHYAVQLENTGTLVGACGPIHYSEIWACLLDGFDFDPEVTEDLREHEADYEVENHVDIVARSYGSV